MKKILLHTLSWILLLTFFEIYVSAATLEYVWFDDWDENGELIKNNYCVYYSEMHDIHCESCRSGAYVLMKFNKDAIASTIKSKLPPPHLDEVQKLYGTENEYMTQWCSCRFIKDETWMLRAFDLYDLSLENDGETLGLYHSSEGGMRRTRESYEVPVTFFLIEKLDYHNKKDEVIKYNEEILKNKKEPGTSYSGYYSAYEIDVLFSGDRELAKKTLKCPGAFYYNGVVYTEYEMVQTLYNYYFDTVGDFVPYTYPLDREGSFGVSSEFISLNKNFEHEIDALVYKNDLFGYLVEQQAYYKKNPVGYNEYLLEALIIKLSEDYPDVEIPTAPQTGIATALLAVAALVSGAYVVKKRRR